MASKARGRQVVRNPVTGEIVTRGVNSLDDEAVRMGWDLSKKTTPRMLDPGLSSDEDDFVPKSSRAKRGDLFDKSPSKLMRSEADNTKKHTLESSDDDDYFFEMDGVRPLEEESADTSIHAVAETALQTDSTTVRGLIHEIHMSKKQPRRVHIRRDGDWIESEFADTTVDFAYRDHESSGVARRTEFRNPMDLDAHNLNCEIPEACVPDTSVLRHTLADFSEKTGVETASLDGLLPTIVSLLANTETNRSLVMSALHALHVSQCKSVVATVLAGKYDEYTSPQEDMAPRLSFEMFISDYIDSMNLSIGDSRFPAFDISDTPLQSSNPVGAIGQPSRARAAAILIALARSMRHIDDIKVEGICRDDWHGCYTTTSEQLSESELAGDSPVTEDLYGLDVVGARQDGLSDADTAAAILATNQFLADDLRKVRASPLGPVAVFVGELYAASSSLSNPLPRADDGDLVVACRALSVWLEPEQFDVTTMMDANYLEPLMGCIRRLYELVRNQDGAASLLEKRFDVSASAARDTVDYARSILFTDTKSSLFSIDATDKFTEDRASIFLPFHSPRSRHGFAGVSIDKIEGYVAYLKQAMSTRTLQPCHLLCAFMLTQDAQFIVDSIATMDLLERRMKGQLKEMAATASTWADEGKHNGILGAALEPVSIASIGVSCLDMVMFRGFVRRVLSPNPLAVIYAHLAGRPADPVIIYRTALTDSEISEIYAKCKFDPSWETVTLGTGQRLVRSMIKESLDGIDGRWLALSQTLSSLVSRCHHRDYTQSEIDLAAHCIAEILALQRSV